MLDEAKAELRQQWQEQEGFIQDLSGATFGPGSVFYGSEA
mgnify:CR=1 FL=1